MDSDANNDADDHMDENSSEKTWLMLAQEECSSVLALIKIAQDKLKNISSKNEELISDNSEKIPDNYEKTPAEFSEWLKKTYLDRTNRIMYFPIEGIFGEPCWDMLLDLAFNKVSGKPVSVTSVCIASKVPITTALRWISILEEQGFIEKVPDPHDRRRTYIELSEMGLSAMQKYFQSI